MKTLFCQAVLASQLDTARKQALTAESNRKQASEAFKRVEKEVQKLVRQAHNALEATFINEPEKAQAWGFVVRQTGRILMPRGRDELLLTLNIYIEKEQTRPEADRFHLPTLTNMITARDALNDHLKNRKEQLRLRKQANAQRANFSKQTRKLLKEAAAYLVVTECGGKICRDLER